MYDYTSNDWSHRHSDKTFEEHLEAMLGKHSVDFLKQTTMLGTSHKLR